MRLVVIKRARLEASSALHIGASDFVKTHPARSKYAGNVRCDFHGATDSLGAEDSDQRNRTDEAGSLFERGKEGAQGR